MPGTGIVLFDAQATGSASPIGTIPLGARLVIALPRSAIVRWACGDRPGNAVATEETGLGFHAAELDTADLAPGYPIDFAWTWRDTDAAPNDKVRVIVGANATEAEQ